MTDRATLRENVRWLMESNQVQSGNYRYTRPAPSTYEQQWLWDSCFHALIYCHFDPEMAKDELRSLLFHRSMEAGGMVPHMIYWAGGGEALWGQDESSFITQPPMIADTALRIYEATGDEAFLREIFDTLVNYYMWLSYERDLDGDYLISIIHPWESGWDASPRWDPLLGLQNPTSEETKQARFVLAQQLKTQGQEMSRIAAKEMFHIEPVDYNAIYAANLVALAQIAAIVGQAEQEAYFEALAEKVKIAINEKMWDESAGFYWPLAGNDETPIKIPTAASFVTLFAQVPSQAQTARLIEQLRTRFWTPYMVPTVAIDHPTFAPEQYWRGSSWLNVNWFIIRGLQAYGKIDLAQRLIDQAVELVEKSGFREYYHPYTGAGLGSQRHSWSGIVLDLLS